MSYGAWTVQEVPLKFGLGELVIARSKLKLMVWFCGIGTWDEVPALPPGAANVDGYLLRGLPESLLDTVNAEVSGCLRYSAVSYRRHFIDLSIGYDEYLDRFSSKTRSALRRKVRKLEKRCGTDDLEFRVCKTEAELRDFFPLARKISSLSYQERTLGLGMPDDDEFRQGMLNRGRNGQAIGFILLVSKRPIAYLYCPIEKGVYLYQYLGYDPEWAAYSPGTVLHVMAMEKLFEQREERWFDFGEGEGPHKELFATDNRTCIDLYVLKRTARLRALVFLHRLMNRVSSALGNMLDRLGIKSKVKAFIRRGG